MPRVLSLRQRDEQFGTRFPQRQHALKAPSSIFRPHTHAHILYQHAVRIVLYKERPRTGGMRSRASVLLFALSKNSSGRSLRDGRCPAVDDLCYSYHPTKGERMKRIREPRRQTLKLHYNKNVAAAALQGSFFFFFFFLDIRVLLLLLWTNPLRPVSVYSSSFHPLLTLSKQTTQM